jgi:uncharacterized protein
MALVYFDSSAFVKLVIREGGSDVAVNLWNGCDAAVSSRLAYPEVCAALAAACRDQRINPKGLRVAQEDWDDFWAATRAVELTRSVEQHAGQLAGEHALFGADALHLASALALRSPDLVMAAWDRRLRAAVASVGFALAPARLDG